MKNAGVGVGIPDTGRVKLIYEEDKKLHIYTGASCLTGAWHSTDPDDRK